MDLGAISIQDSDFYPNFTMNISFVDTHVLLVGVPFVATAGLMLNTLVLILTLKYHIANKLCEPLVALLCISDGGFLLILLLSWIGKNYINIFVVSGVCQIVTFTSLMFGFTSSWMVVSLCAMTLVSLTNPQKFFRLCTPTASRLIVSVFGTFIFAGFLYKTWTHDTTDTIKGPICTVIPENELAMRILSTIDVLLILIVPCLVIFIIQLCLMSFVLSSSCRKQDGPMTLDVVHTSRNTTMKDKMIETSYATGNDKDGKVSGLDLEEEEAGDLELLNVTNIFMEPLNSIGKKKGRGSSVSWDNWTETKVTETSTVAVSYSDLALNKWKNTMIFSLCFMCLVLPGAIENIAFMAESDNVMANLEIYTSSTHQVFQLMFYCHFALDAVLYVGFTSAFWKTIRKKPS